MIRWPRKSSAGPATPQTGGNEQINETWTYDPLQSRNAHLNLRRLGAVAAEFLPNFYGVTTSALHHGILSARAAGRTVVSGGGGPEAARVRGDEPRPRVPLPTPHSGCLRKAPLMGRDAL